MCKGYKWLVTLGWANDLYFETLAEARAAAREFLAGKPEGSAVEACTVYGTPQRCAYGDTKCHVFEREGRRVVEWSYDPHYPRR